MTNPDGKGGGNNAPSWVDEVLDSSSKAPAQAPASAPAGAPQDLRIPEAAPRPAPAPSAPAASPDDDWVARATGSSAKSPSMPSGPAVNPEPTRSGFDEIEQSAKQAMQQFGQAVQSGDVSQKKLIAGLLGIFLGSLGVHKFYLGMNNAGIIMLAATIGGWILGFIGSFIIVGAVFFFLPMLVSILGLIEGIIYLTKSDADFKREYIDGKKPWL